MAKWLLNKKRCSTFLHAGNRQDKFNHSDPFCYILGMATQKAFLSDLCHRIDINAFPLDTKEKISSFRFPLLDEQSESKEILHIGAVTVLKSFQRNDITSTSVHFGQDLWLYMATNLSIGRTKQISIKCGDLNYTQPESMEMNSLFCNVHRLTDFRFECTETDYADQRLLEVGKVVKNNIIPLFDELAFLIKDENQKSGFLDNVLNAKDLLDKAIAIPTAKVENPIIPWRGKDEIFASAYETVSAREEDTTLDKKNDEDESEPASSSFDNSSKERNGFESSESFESSEGSRMSTSDNVEESDTNDAEEANVEKKSEDKSKNDATGDNNAKNGKGVPKEEIEQQQTPKKAKSVQKKPPSVSGSIRSKSSKPKPKNVVQTPTTNRAKSRRSSFDTQLQTMVNGKKRDAATSELKRLPPSPGRKRLRPRGDNS